jgi:7-carboxy-7-deazaguanine synthase
VKTVPVIEIFGPTLQGEGVDQGLPVHFVRVGGCDYRCVWCDTPYAVLPHLVRKSERMSSEAIVQRVRELGGAPEWVVVSGGNPALHDLTLVVEGLTQAGFRIAVETQGTRWRDWLLETDRMCVSPKPPSSGMVTDWDALDRFVEHASERSTDSGDPWLFIKVVVFDDADYEYACEVHARYPDVAFFLSAGNDPGATVGDADREDARTLAHVRNDLCVRSAWLAAKAMRDKRMERARIQSQYHVLLWGNQPGV